MDVGNLISGSSAFFSKFSLNTFRYDLNQVPYDYTVEVTNIFKGLDLIERVPDKPWNKVRDLVQEAVIKTIPRKINAKRQNDCMRRAYK